MVSRETSAEPAGDARGPHRGRPRGRRDRPLDDDSDAAGPGGRAHACWPGRAPRMRPPLPRPEATRVIVVANQKGGVGKTTTDGERGGRAGPARAAGPRDRPRPAGQRLDRARRSSTTAAPRRRTTRWSTASRWPRSSRTCPDVRGPVRRAGHHRPGRRRDRAGQRGGPREPAAQGDRTATRWSACGRRAARTASTTSSSTARRRWACSRSTRWWPAREMLIPIQAEYYALEGLGQLLETVEMVKAHLNPGLAVSTILLTMYDARTRLAAGVADEVREPLRRPGAARPRSRARCGSRRRRRTGRP